MIYKTKLTKDAMTQLRIGEVLTVRCANTLKLDAAYQNACHVRRKYPREDGGRYRVARSARTMTVTVTVEKGGDDGETGCV